MVVLIWRDTERRERERRGPTSGGRGAPRRVGGASTGGCLHFQFDPILIFLPPRGRGRGQGCGSSSATPCFFFVVFWGCVLSWRVDYHL